MTSEPGEGAPRPFKDLVDPVEKNTALKDFFDKNFTTYQDLRDGKIDHSSFDSQNAGKVINGSLVMQGEFKERSIEEKEWLEDLSNEVLSVYLGGVDVANATKIYIASCLKAFLVGGKREDISILKWFNGQRGGIYSEDPEEVESTEIEIYHMASGQRIVKEVGATIGESVGRFPPLPEQEFLRQWDAELTRRYGARF